MCCLLDCMQSVQKAVYWLNKHKVQSGFNQYIKSNVKLYGEGRGGFFQEKLTEHSF